MNGTVYEGYAGLLGGRIKHAAMLLYLINPYESSFKHHEEVPDYQVQVWLPFFVLIALENAILFAKKGSRFRLNDQVTSLSHWILQETARILFRGAEYYAYIEIYENYRLWSLAWNSAWTWYITALAVDFCYYWVHRANHEVTFLWVHHQVHHSSEEFNLVVGLRQSILQQWCSFMFYLPLALFIPPSHFVAHHQFNLIYQLWIHTTIIEDLGPLEWIFNTPKHHRVHHGCNLYCLDTNYGGVLIIWDRIFGTFAEERPKEELIYGLVVSPQSYEPLYLQVFYSMQMIGRSLSMGNLRDRLAVWWKGPSWQPGLPRLGLDQFKVNIDQNILVSILQMLAVAGLLAVNKRERKDKNIRIFTSLHDRIFDLFNAVGKIANDISNLWNISLLRLLCVDIATQCYVTSRIKYDPRIPTWQSCYIVLHFCLVLYTHVQLYDEKTDTYNSVWIAMIINNVCALTTIGLLFDRSSLASFLELMRCCGYLYFLRNYQASLIASAYVASCCLWIYDIVRSLVLCGR